MVSSEDYRQGWDMPDIEQHVESKVDVHICFSAKWELVILMTMGQAHGVVGHLVMRHAGEEGGRLGIREEHRIMNQKDEWPHSLPLGLGSCLGCKMKKLGLIDVFIYGLRALRFHRGGPEVRVAEQVGL